MSPSFSKGLIAAIRSTSMVCMPFNVFILNRILDYVYILALICCSCEPWYEVDGSSSGTSNSLTYHK